MKVIVFSDSHGNSRNLSKALKQHQDADMYIHLGDGEVEFNRLKIDYPQLKMYHVAGNCDYDSLHPNDLILGADYNVKIFATHGHRYYVKYSMEAIEAAARENGCQIALFGHTHVSYNSYQNGLYVMNPGSISCPRDGQKPSYGIVEVTKSGIMTNIVYV